ncbi:MAG TPA: hypothetical protein VF077_11570, partial [Nitrospiraceae bacterium]
LRWKTALLRGHFLLLVGPGEEGRHQRQETLAGEVIKPHRCRPNYKWSRRSGLNGRPAVYEIPIT